MMAYMLPGTGPSRRSGQSAAMHKAMSDSVDQYRDWMSDNMIVDNSTASARDPNEASLMVGRAPHVVRPPHETGVQYRISEGRLDVALENCPSYPTDSIDVQTPHRLCQACLDVLHYYCQYQEARSTMTREEQIQQMSNTVIHHFNLVSLIARAQIDECHLCKQLYGQLKRRYSAALELESLEQYRTEVCWTISPKTDEGVGRLYFILTQPSLQRDIWNFCHYFRAQVWDETKIESFQVMSRGEDDPPLSVATNTGSSASAWLATTWVFGCLENENGIHDRCSASTNTGHLPTRLLNLELARRTGQLRLFVPGEQPEEFENSSKFITLSHCWGKLTLPVLTTRNLDERRISGLSMNEVPKSFQDAMEVASWFQGKIT